MVVQTRKRKAALEQATAPAVEEAPSTSATPKRQKLPVRSKGDESPAQKRAGNGTLITFNDDGGASNELGAPAPTSQTVAPSTAPEGAGQDSDDDGAPEAVSTAQAASDIKKSAQATQTAARAQAVVEKRRRQERDALLKKQAEERNKAEQEAAAAAKPQRRAASTGRRRRAAKIQMPNLLPVELLTDASSDEDEAGQDETGQTEGEASGSTRPRARDMAAVERSLSLQDRPPRDERVGSTVYRVAKTTDERLAPKANKCSMKRKEMLLRRSRTAVPARPGFLIKK